MTDTIAIGRPADLDAAAVLRIARGAAVPVLTRELTGRVEARRETVLGALAAQGPVYGVNTGMGAFSERRLDEAEQSRHQESLMLARSVGGPPWLTAEETRAVLAVRLRTLLAPESGVSAVLCVRLAEMIARGVLPALPRDGLGSAGEIIPLAHLGAALGGRGGVLPPPGAATDPVPAGPALAAAGLAPLPLGPKEGVALIEGVPVTTALAVLCADAARTALTQGLHTVAGEFALTGASRDALHPALGRADPVLADVNGRLLALVGPQHGARGLQPPVSFRVSGQVLAQLARATGLLEDAVRRALDGVTDSPAYVDEDGTGRFLGTPGFHGYDLASQAHVLTVALVGAAELGATRLHRMMDARVSGRTAQLSPRPGPHAGVSPVHKRAAGVVHALRRLTAPATVGTVEGSGGQEDTQSFSVEAAECCRRAALGLADVTACELLALHQARRLGAVPPPGTQALARALDLAGEPLPDTTEDRFFGEDLTRLRALLAAGWPGPGAARA
ncbi:aromatic amino acid lyase [Streptomyces sp. NPDC050560]|uniref:aromatic amino acid lyase n=1 Tax=Streptomyces sp. NPDC050560 TaxID=3365630 RepID=UPI0037B7B278